MNEPNKNGNRRFFLYGVIMLVCVALIVVIYEIFKYILEKR